MRIRAASNIPNGFSSNKSLVVLSTIMLIIGCNSSSKKRLLFPENYSRTLLGKKTMIVYYRGTCISCFLKKSFQWRPFTSYAQEHDDFDFILILRQKDSIEISAFLETTDLAFPIYLDEGSFYEQNRNKIIGNTSVFLIDESGKILLRGSPIYNMKRWEQYIELITK